MAETRNFLIRHQGRRDRAERFARAAEQARAAAFKKWFGEARASWQPRCEIWLYPTGTSFRRATGLPEAVPAVSTTRCDGDRVLSRRIDLHADMPHCLDAILPHEITHVVMADYFGTRLPPWANEGMAIQVEPCDCRWAHLCHLPQYRQEQRLFPARRLLQTSGYPGSGQMGPFYAQSASMVKFLTRQKDPKIFVQFLRDAEREGSEKALRRHYQWSFEELDLRWREYAFGDVAVAARK